jgi:hypothetical protein
LLQTLAAPNSTSSVMLDKTPRSKGATLETCPSGQLLEIGLAARHATGVRDVSGLGSGDPRGNRSGTTLLTRQDRR